VLVLVGLLSVVRVLVEVLVETLDGEVAVVRTVVEVVDVLDSEELVQVLEELVVPVVSSLVEVLVDVVGAMHSKWDVDKNPPEQAKESTFAVKPRAQSALHLNPSGTSAPSDKSNLV